MKKKKELLFLIVMLILTIGMNQTSFAQPKLALCDATTKLESSKGDFQFNLYGGNITFTTNFVCGATSYTWTIDEQYSVSTNVPYITIDSSYFVWYPAGGCTEFNNSWKAYLPGTLGKERTSLGTYTTTLSVKANAGIGNTLVKTVLVENVLRCSDGLPSFGKDKNYGEDDLKWVKDGLKTSGN